MKTVNRNVQHSAELYATDSSVSAHQAPADRYGMTEAQYKVYREDCEESALINEDILYFLTHDPDASAYLF